MIKKLLGLLSFAGLIFTQVSAQSLGNNTCANAVTLTVNAGCTSGNNTTATATGDPAASCFTVENGIWFRFVAPTFGTYVTISTDFAGTNFDSQLALYSGTCGALTQLGCDDDGGTGTNSVLTATCLNPGQTYYVMLDGYAGDIGNFCINVTAPNTPHNDWCSCANPLLLNGTCQNGTTTNADNDVTSAVGCQSTGANGEVWYTFVADSSSVAFNITAGTLGGNIEFNLLRGSCSSLTLIATQCSPGTLSYTAQNLTIGATYYVMISSANTSQGTFQICADSFTPPTVPGQDCPTAAILCNSNTFTQPTSNAGFGTQEVNTLNSCWGSGGERQSRWYKFTVGCTGTFTFNITPVNNNDDYDWAIWNITTAGCPTTAATTNDPVACNWYGLAGVNGSTGLSANAANACTNENAVDYTGNPACDPYAFYNQSAGNYNPLNVTAGNTYAILIDNFTTSNSGFSISFGGTATIGPNAAFTYTNPACTRAFTPTKTCLTTNSTYLWDFGDGSTSTLQTPGTHTYAADGTYTVSLTVTDALGCARTTSQTVTIVSPPVAPTVTGTTICSGTTASLTPTAPGGTYAWYTAATGGTLLFTGSTYTTPVLSANTTYYVQTTVNGCTSTRTPVTVTVNTAATANAGADATICGSSSFALTGSIGGSATTLLWTTSGTGTFSNSASATSNYTASAADITAGSVTLTLTTNDPAGPCPAVSDVMVLTFNTPATVSAGADASICAGSTYTLSGTRGGSATSSTWTTSGTGTFSSSTSLTPVYTPSAADITAGSVTLTITTNDPAGPCPAVSDFMVLTISPVATANAGADATICSSTGYSLSGSIGGSATSLTWTTSGTGTFSSATSATATYTPSAADITAGSVTLTLTTNDPAGPCPAVSDAMVLTINRAATASANSDATICSGSTYTLAGSIGGGATSLTWTTSGSGSFSNSTSATAVYTPSAADITAGSVTLTLTTNDPAGPCPLASDAMVLTINPAAVANAGADATICGGSTYTLAGSISGGATSLTWTTSGTGTFSSSTSATATYTPSAADITAGSVTLTITTNDPAGPCPSASDAMVLTINQAATANAGIDKTICANNTVSITGTIGGSASSLTWSTSGTGSFSSTTAGTTTYTPSAADITAGSVTITLTTNDPAGACPAATDQMIVTITPRDNASFSYANSTYCQTGANPTPTITGLAGGTFTSAPAGLVINASTGLINLAGSTIGTYTVTYTTNGACPNTATFTVTITTAPNATFSYSGPYCQSGANPTPTFPAGASAGTFSAPAGLVFVSTTTGQINLSASTPGTYTVTNSIAAGGGCSATSSTASVTINQAATASANADATICGGSTYTLAGSIGGSASSLTWTTSGTGTFSSATSATAVYTPSGADITAGSVTLTITTNDPAGACPAVSDALVLTINPAATANAGADATICSGSTYTLNGSIGGGATTLTWSSSGTGTFSSTTSATAVYTPSAADVTAGSVTLTLTTNDPAGPCPAATDIMILTINPIPTANAGADATICAGSTHALTGVIGGGASTVTWTTSGSGTFSSSTSLTPTYTPSAADITAGIITLTMTTNDPAGPCGPASDNLVLTINQSATANAGSDATICSGSTYALSGSIGGSAVSLTWTTSGSGTFSSSTSATATYTPSAADITAGSVTLTLTTNDPAGPCTAATDVMVLTINPAATANAGTNATICSGSTYTLSGSIGGGASSVTWTTNGSGTFSSTTSLTPVYTPSAADITAGLVTLTMTTNDPAGPCPAASANINLTINQPATASAGADATICSGSTYALTGSFGGSATTITWTTSGSGTFSSASSATATYTPSAADVTAGSVTLTITTNDPAGPCPVATDNMVLTINSNPTVNVGADAIICQGSTYSATATIGGAATSVTWSSTGTGSFSSTTSLTPVYTPSAADISAGSVILSVVTNDPAGPCPSASDNLLLTINPAPTVSAGADESICAGSTFILNGAIGGSATSMTWTTSGSGSFSSTTSPNPIYTPSAGDIASGSVTLTLTTDDPAGPCIAVSDAMVLTIFQAPTVSAGLDATICANNTYTLNGSSGGSATSITWSSSGSGSFSSSTTTNPVYTPSAADVTAGSVTITITTNDPAGPCTAVTDQMVLTITPLDNATFSYSSSTYCLTGTDPTPTITGLGGGTFSSSPAGLVISAATGMIDVSASAVGTYNVTYTTNGACPNTSTIAVTITNAPSATFSYAGPYCQTGINPMPTFPGGSSAGTFSSTAGLVFANTSTGEINLSASTPGTYTVTNTIAPAGGCAAASATASVTIETPATINSGANQTICAGSVVTLTGTIGGSATSGTWTTSGTGTFGSSTSLNTTYTPSAADISGGSITLTLTTNDPAGSCPAVTDPLTVSINAAPVVTAGSDAVICSGSTVALTGTFSGSATSITWSSSGSGTFSSTTTASTVYTPSATDITNGTVNITITSNDPAGPCPAATDVMVLTINAPATVNAGIDITICQGSNANVSATLGGSATSVTWTTSGTGTFASATSASTVYTPSAADITAGTVTLTATSNDPAGPCPSASDNLILTINMAATVNAGADNTICSGSTVTLAGVVGGSATTGTWTTSGSGTFNNPNSSSAVYTPSAADITAGTVNLTFTTNDPAGVCPAVSDVMVLTINPAAIANAGADATICSGSTYTLSGSVSGGASTLTWSTSGTGTFSSATAGNAVYTPSAADITAGAVTLTLTTNDPAGPCTQTTDAMILTINPAAVGNAGPDATICAGSTHTLAGTVNAGATTLTWSTSGTGTFSSTTSSTAVYTPSAADVTAGSVTITLTTNDPAGPCPAATDFMVLTINQAATANAGIDASVCANGTYTLNGSVGGSASSLTWSTSGTGTFSSATSGTATYTPSGADVSSGVVTITLTTNDPAGVCPAVTDNMILSITPLDNASFSYSPSTFCQTAADPTPSILLPGGTFTSNPAGLSINASSGTIDLSASSIGSFTVTYTTAGTCPNSSSMTVTITTAPSAQFSLSGSYCQSAGTATPNFSAGSSAGTFSSTPAGLVFVNSSTGEINLTASTPGVYLITNDIPPTGDCAAATFSDTITIDSPALANAGMNDSLCSGSSYTLSGSVTNVAGGTWSSLGDGSFGSTTSLSTSYTPGTADLSSGSITIVLTSDDPAGVCPQVTDTMQITVMTLPVANAGANDTICAGSSYTLSGNVTGVATGTWSTLGDGSFTNSTVLNTDYIPGSADTANGTVQLILTSADPVGPCGAVTDTVRLTINPIVVVNAGTDAGICKGSSYQLSGTVIGASIGSWTTTGDGTFDNASLLNATYTPGVADTSAGSVALVLTSTDPAGPCGIVTDTVMINISQDALANAGSDIQSCGGSTVTLSGTISGAASSLTWSGGTGTFSNPSSGSSTYTPSATDLSNGSVTLVISTDDPAGSCLADTDTLTIVFNAPATVSLGNDTATCGMGSVTLNASLGGSATSIISWTTTGTGTFSAPSGSPVTYIPTAADTAAGTVIIYTMTDDPSGVCSAASDTVLLTLEREAFAVAGSDSVICGASLYQLAGSFSGSAIMGTWTTNGSGSFDNSSAMNAVYTPSAADISAGSVDLILTTNNPSGLCPAAKDTVTLTINTPALITAGNDTTTCGGSPVNLSGAMGGSTTVINWSTSGTGSFSSSTGTSVTYTGSAADITSGSVNIILTSDDPAGSCPAVTDTLVVTFRLPATAAAGNDTTICGSSVLNLNGIIGGSATSASWTTLGTGTFSNSGSPASTYSASAADILNGSATLILSTNDPSGECPATSDTIIVTLEVPAVIGLGNDTAVCGGSALNLTAAFSGSATSVSSWNTTGSGTFANTTGTTNTYTASSADILAGTVLLTVTTDDPAGTCLAVTDTITVSFSTPATVSAGTDSTICGGSTYTLNAVMGGSATSLVWTTTGTGSFDNAALANATYTPSAADISAGSLSFIVTTDDPAGVCGPSADTVSITFGQFGAVSAGLDTTLFSCTPVNYTLGGSSSVTGPSIVYSWTTADGSIVSGANTLNAVVSESGTYTITVTDTVSGCSNTDQVTITMTGLMPAMTVSATPLTGMAPLNVTFTATGANNYFWDFADSTVSTEANPFHTFSQAGTYVVMVTGYYPNGCTTIDSVIIEVTGKSNFEVPNVFSPNEDGNNDVFNVIADHLKSLHGVIYNRWGELIYEWDTVEGGWDGVTNSGVKVSNGTYLYIIDATGFDGEIYHRKGFVTLVR